MKKTVIVIGTKDDYQSVHVYNSLFDFGCNPVMFDTRLFPSQMTFSYNILSPMDGYFKFNGSDRVIELSTVSGAYYRWFKGILRSPSMTYEEELDYWNNESSLNSFLRMLDCNWVNTPSASKLHTYKPLHLKKMKIAGINLPHTTITNDLSLINHLKESEGKFIFKPVRGWDSPKLLNDEKSYEEMIPRLSKVSFTVQEYIEGTDLRVYVVGNEIYPVEIIASDIDSREGESEHKRTTLPPDICEVCLKITSALGLYFSAIDMKRSKDGEYFVLEANATPIYVNDENICGYPITQKICEYLVS